MNLCAIIVLYNPTLSQVENKIKVLTNTPTIFVDNSKEPFETLVSNKNADHRYLHNGINLGIAAAHNIGIETAKKEFKADYVIILDQDSDLNLFFIENCRKDLEMARDLNFAVISPRLINIKNNIEYKLDVKGSIGQNFKIVNKASSSGSLIPVKTFDIIGNFNENLFIDLVDSEWCWRANSLGFECLVSNTNILFHDIGEQDINFLGLHFIRSKPIRMFYQYRNWLILIKEKHIPVRWKLAESIKKIIFIVLLLFHSPTKQDIYQIIRGISEGVRTKLE